MNGPDYSNFKYRQRRWSQHIQNHESVYEQRMGEIVRAVESKMVNVSSRLPFNLHNRVIHDSVGSRSQSESMGYDPLEGSDHNDDSGYHYYRQSLQKPAHEERFPVYYQRTPSRSPSERVHSTLTEAERNAERPAAILNLRLVGVTEVERGRARERSTKPTGLGGGSASFQKVGAPTSPVNAAESDSITPSMHQFKLDFIDPSEMILSSWNDSA